MLTRLRVNGFKNLVDADVRFGPFTCVAGANGVGKSNLFDAIRFLSSLADKPFVDAARCVRDESQRAGEVRALFHQGANGPASRMKFVAATERLTSLGVELPHHVPVVAVRMSEAWLLFDEAAIRRAAGSPRSRARLNLSSRKPDTIAGPKRTLNLALDAASELTGRKLEKFRQYRRPELVAEEITDFTPLRQLDAFRAFEADVAAFAARWRADCDAGAATDSGG